MEYPLNIIHHSLLQKPLETSFSTELFNPTDYLHVHSDNN